MNSQSSVETPQAKIAKSPFRQALYGALSQIRQRKLKQFATMLAGYDKQIEVISEQLFEKLSLEDQSTFVQWFLFRWGGISILNQFDIKDYRASVKKFSHEPQTDVEFKGKTLKKVNCASQGYDFNLVQYDFVCGVQRARHFL